MKNYSVIRWFIPALGMVCGLGWAASSGGGAAEATVATEPVTVAVVAVKPCTRPVKMDAVPLARSAKPQAAVKPAIKAPRVVVKAKAKPVEVAPAAPVAEMWEGSGKCEGVASFYAGRFLGRKTANGEVYTGRKLTAAHRVLPFGTYVRVTNLENGLDVIVRINDRGPYIAGRVIDLSPAAARKLHMTKQGVVKVRMETVAAWMAE